MKKWDLPGNEAGWRGTGPTSPFRGGLSTPNIYPLYLGDNFREKIYEYRPAESATINTIAAKAGKVSSTPNIRFDYAVRSFNRRGGYTAELAGGDVYVLSGQNWVPADADANGVEGDRVRVLLKRVDTVEVQGKDAVATEFRKHQIVNLQAPAAPEFIVAMIITDIGSTTVNGVAYPHLEGRLLNSQAAVSVGEDTFGLGSVRVVYNAGSSVIEGSRSTDSINTVPMAFYNYVQIFRTDFAFTRTWVDETYAQLGPKGAAAKIAEERKQKLLWHTWDLDAAVMSPVPPTSRTTDWDGATQLSISGILESPFASRRTLTGGLIYFLKTFAPNNIKDFAKLFPGQTFASKGEEFLDAALPPVFQWNSTERIAVCGNRAYAAIIKYITSQSQLRTLADSQTKMWGYTFTTLITPYGTLHFQKNAAFSLNPILQSAVLVYEPEYIEVREFQPTAVFETANIDKGSTDFDGYRYAIITALGYEYHYPECFGLWFNVA